MDSEKTFKILKNSSGQSARFQGNVYFCGNCDWRYVIPQNGMLELCPHCYKNEIQPFGMETQDLTPNDEVELVIPFEFPVSSLNSQLDLFVKGIPFPPKDLNIVNLNSRMKRIFLPSWLVDIQSSGKWWAEAGFDYQVVSHQAHYDENFSGWTSRELTEGRIRWEPRLGYFEREIHNIFVPAIEEQNDINQKIGFFQLDKAKDYRLEEVKNSIISIPNRDIKDVWMEAVPAVQAAVGEECRRAAKADHIRNFKWDVRYGNKNWTLALLPLYSTYYYDDDQIIQPVFVHGQSGRMNGVRHASMKAGQKLSVILFAIALALFVISLIFAGVSLTLPVLLVFAILFFGLALVVGIASAVPLLMVWRFNRDQEHKPGGFFAS